MKRKGIGKRTFAAFLAASMILSVSTELASAAAGAQGMEKAVSEVSEVSSTAVTSAEKSNASATIVSESAALSVVKAPTGLKGSGTKSDPYQIGDIDDFLRMKNYVNYEKSSDKHFILTADIDLSLAYFPATDSKDFAKKSDFVSSEGIYSIVSALPSLSGNANVSFQLDGNGFAFKNLNVSVPSGVRAAAVFGYVSSNTVIENVTFQNCHMAVKSGTDGAYALVAVQNFGTVRNVTVSDCAVDARQSDALFSDETTVTLDCGKVCKGVSLVAAENSGTISGVQVQSSDSNHGISVKGGVKYVGAVAGQNRKTISSSSVSGVRILAYGSEDGDGSINGSGETAKYIGMIAGSNDAAGAKCTAVISDCTVQFVHGSDLMYGSFAGGLVGLNAGSIMKSYVKGSCSDAGSAANMVGSGYMGGLVGVNRGSIASSGSYDLGFSFIRSSSQNVYGGIVAQNDGSVQQVVASGYINTRSAEDCVGGIVGEMLSGNVSQTYSFVNVSGATEQSGAVFGKNGTVASVGTDNFWVGSSQGFASAVPNGGAALNTLQSDTTLLNVPSGDEGMTFTKASLSNSWAGSDAVTSIDFTKPVQSDTASIKVEKTSESFTLKSVSSGVSGTISYAVRVQFPASVGAGQPVSARVSVPVLVTDSANRGAGSSVSNPIVLTSYEQFKFIRIAPNAHYRLDDDIVIGSDWEPIAFSGTLNGCGHSICVSGGLFSVVSGSRDNSVSSSDWATSASNMASGVIRDLEIKASGTVRGSVFGSLDNVTFDKITYSVSDENAFVVLSSPVSGALADAVSGNAYFHNCYVSVPVTVTASASDGIAALVGSVSCDAFRMDNCGSSSVLAIDGHNLPNVGGLIGHIAAVQDGAITNCYASGSVYVKPVVENVKANIVIGSVSSDAAKHLATDHCYYSVAESAVSGGSVAFNAADNVSDGIVSLSSEQKTYSVDPEGKQETEVVVSLPQELDACQNVQPEDFSFIFEDESMYISTEADASGSDVTIGVMADDSVEVNSSSSLTVIHEPTGLIITDVMSADSPTPDVVGGYYEIYNVTQWQAIASGWGTTYPANGNYKLCADIAFGTENSHGTLSPLATNEMVAFSGEFIGASSGSGKYTLSYGDISGKGLFGYTKGATFSNFALEGISVTSMSQGIGVLVGSADYNGDSSTSFSDIDIVDCSVVSTFSSSLDIENEEVLTVEDHTAQVGTLAGALDNTNSSDNYSIESITVTDTSVTATGEYAYAVGGLIGYAYCTTGTVTSIGVSDSDPSIVLSGVTVNGYASVGGVLGMAGNFPSDANYGIGDYDWLYGDDVEDYLGTLEITNVSVQDDSTVTADAGACGGILGSELAGFVDYDDSYVLITECAVSDTTIISYSELSSGSQVSAAAACGGIAGYCGGTVSYCTVTDCVIRSATAGGVVGRPSRKHYSLDNNSDGYMTGVALSVTNCNVLGSGTLISNVTGEDALHLGGIVATAMNTNLLISECGVGEGVNITGAAQHIGGFIGYVYSFDEVTGEEVSYYVVEVTQSVFAGNVQIPTSAQISDTAVGGCVGYAEIVPEALRIHNDYFGGSIQNAEYCGGVIGHIYVTYEWYMSGLYYDDTMPFIVGCTIASLLNNGASSAYTCKMIACLGDSSSAIFGLFSSSMNDIAYNNILSSYPQDCRVYGDFADGSPIDSGYYDPFLATYCDINRPDTYNETDPTTAEAAVYFDGYAPADGPWVIDSDLSASDTVTVDSNGFIMLSSVEDATSNITFSSFFDAVTWGSSSTSVLLVDDSDYENDGTLTVTGQSNSGVSPVYVYGALDVMYYLASEDDYFAFLLPGTSTPATIRVGAPFECVNFSANVVWTEVDGWMQIPDFQHLDDLQNRISNTSLNQNYVVTADISLQNETFSPVPGTFTGQFKCAPKAGGGYYTISNWTYSTDSVTTVGLFTAAEGAVFTNVSLQNFALTTSAGSSRAGALVGTAEDTEFNNIIISNSSVYATEYAGVVAAYVTDAEADGITLTNDTVGSVTANNVTYNAKYVGGVFGHAAVDDGTNSIENATVTNLAAKSYSSSDNLDIAAGIAAEFSGSIASVTVQKTEGATSISGSSVSGVIGKTVGNTTVGSLNDTSVAGATVTGMTISSTNSNISSRAGGVVALHDSGTLAVAGCTVTSAVSSSGSTGGVVGETVAAQNITGIKRCVLGGTLAGGSSASSAAGGVVGLVKGTPSNGTLSDTVFYSTISGSGSNGAAVGKVVDSNGNVVVLATAPVSNFYYSSYQIPDFVLCGSSVSDTPSITCSSVVDLQTVLQYNKNDDIGRGKRFEFINYSGGAYSVDVNAFTLPTGSSGTYKSFIAPNGVAFSLSRVVFSSGSSWNISSNALTPTVSNGTDRGVFTYANGIQITFDVYVSDIRGDGLTEGTAYLIENVGQLSHLADPTKSSAYFRITDDLDLTGWGAGSVWTNSTWENINFTGQLDGDDHELSNLAITGSTRTYTGFFCKFSGTLKDIKFADCSVTSTATGVVAGTGIVAGFSDGSLQNVSVTNSTVSGARHVGGLVGVSFGTVSNCSFIDNVTGDAKCTVTSTAHCAGGIIGGGYNATNCEVNGVVVSGYDMAGGIAGGTLSFSNEVITGRGFDTLVLNSNTNTFVVATNGTDGLVSTYQNSGKAMLFHNDEVIGTEIKTANANVMSFAGGIVGIAETGTSALNRGISIKNCSVDSDSSVTANALSGSSAQNNYAGGIVGYLDQYYGSTTYTSGGQTVDVGYVFVIDNCTMNATVTANGTAGSNDLTSAGGLLGATTQSGNFKFRKDADGSPLEFYLYFNIVNATVSSAKYVGGLIGRFAANVPNSFPRCKLKDGDDFICKNIIAAALQKETPAAGSSSATLTDHMGVVAGLFRPYGTQGNYVNNFIDLNNKTVAEVAYTIIKDNYYSSDVSCLGAYRYLSLFSQVTDEYMFVSCGTSDVARTVKNNSSVGSLLVSNANDGTFQDLVNGRRPAGTYVMPVQLKFKVAAAGSTVTESADLGTVGNEITLQYGASASQQDRFLTLDATKNTQVRTYNPIDLIPADASWNSEHHYFQSVFGNNGSSYYTSFTIGEDAGSCEQTTNLVADLGYGLLVYIGVQTGTMSGSSYNINNEHDFASYFFGEFAKGIGSDYLFSGYVQTADLDFSQILYEISRLDSTTARSTTFSPIGTAAYPFYGSYNGGGHRITGFSYDGTTAADPNVGLFGYVGSTGQLKDIHIELDENGVTGGISNASCNVGGLVGYYGGAEPIVNCSVLYGTVCGEATTSGTHVNVGGLVGETSGAALRYCFTSTDIRVADETAANDSNQATVYAASGLVGNCDGGSMSFDRCFTSSDVVGSNYVGAFLGRIIDYSSSNNQIKIRNCFSTASVTSLRHIVFKPSGRPVPLVTGYKYSVGGFNSADLGADGTPYVSAMNLYVSGANTSEFSGSRADDYSYVSLFGFCAPTSDSANIYYNAEVIGRLNFTANGGSTTGFIRVDGSLRNGGNTAIADISSVSAMRKTTAELTDTTFALGTAPADASLPYFADVQDLVVPTNTVTAGNAWIADLANLYPVLCMNDSNNTADTYSQAVAKISAMPIFLDPREADDVSANRDYTGVTYPVSMSNTLGDAALSYASSDYSAASDDNYPANYDVNLRGGSITARTWSSGQYAVTASANTNKNTDFLFKSAAGTTEFSVIRNVNLGYDEDAVRDIRTPCVYVWGSIDGSLTETSANYTICRSVRIPLRSEENRVYVATERQLRAIQDIRSGAESAAKFVDAYCDVTKATPSSSVQNTEYYGAGRDVLVCADIELNPAVSFTPIQNYKRGSVGEDLSGFDGGNCEISNMMINMPNADYVGMFASLSGGENSSGNVRGVKIQNIILRDVQVSGKNYVGALVGQVAGTGDYGSNTNCEILNCMVRTSEGATAYVNGKGNFVGGLIGYAASTMINYVHNDDKISYTPKTTGATNGIANNKVTGADVPVIGCNYVGGLIGAMSKVTAANCFASGEVTFGGAYDISGNELSYVTDTNTIFNGKLRLAYGGFTGLLGESCDITFCFASGNVLLNLPQAYNNGNGVFYIGVGGFAGASEVPIENCFATGDVDCEVASYFNNAQGSTYHGIGGLVGYTSASVSNAYSTSAVSTRNDPTSAAVTMGVGGVVGISKQLSGDAAPEVTSVYSSGSVSATENVIDANDLPSMSGTFYIGGAAGYVEGTAQKAFFDLWTNHILNLRAVGNKADVEGSLDSYSTDVFCNGSLVGGSSSALSNQVWGVDPEASATSNTYPYLKAFFDDDKAVSNYVRFPAALSVAAIRPNDRDTSARSGEGYSMAVTIPEYVQVSVTSGGTPRTVKYYLDSTDVNGNAGTVRYGKTTYAPQRDSNGAENVRMRIWVKSYLDSGVQHIGFYEQVPSNTQGALEIVENAPAGSTTQISLSTVLANRKETYEPRIGQYVKLSDGFREYGERSVQRAFRRMLGTSKYPYLITNVEELNHIYFASGYTVPANDTYYDHWYSQQQLTNNTFVNVPVNTDSTQNDDTTDGVIHFRLMINIDMSKTVGYDANNQPVSGNAMFTAIGNRNYAVEGIAYSGYELDGNDYAIVNFTSNSPFITELDSKSTVKNLVFSGATLGSGSATGDLALIGTNNGTVDGLMLLEGDTDTDNGVTKTSSVTTTDGSAAGLVVTNNGTITKSIAQGTISGGASVKYVGGIAAVNNGTITNSVSAAAVLANASTTAAGGLVGKNNTNKTIEESFTLGSVTGTGNTFVGGFVGENSGSVSYAYSRTEVTGAVSKTGSFVGKNAGSIIDSFSAGKTIVTGTTVNSIGSAFVGTTDNGTLSKSYADKALLTSNAYMLLGDAEVTEKICDLSCFDNTGSKYTATTNVSTNDGYPQLSSILALDDAQTYTIGGTTQTYKMLKVRLLQAYSKLAAVTLDSPAGNYVDNLPAGVAYTLTGSTTGCTVTDTNGRVSVTTPSIAQKIGAGSVDTDDLKYVLTFGFDHSEGANPNFPSGVGTSAAPYQINNNASSGYTAAQSFASLAYFGRATDANIQMATDVSYGGTGGSLADYPITVFRAVLNGNGKTVSDLDMTKGGLLGKVESTATVQKFGLVGVDLSLTPTAAGNYGLLANEVYGATVQNVYAVGELKITYGTGATHYATNVGGLIGYAEDATVSGVVTSGSVRNDSTTTGSAAGGVIGAMNGGSLSAATSTAYVYGVPVIGGIVGRETGTSTISNVIFASQAADAYMTNNDTTDTNHIKDGKWAGNVNWNVSGKADAAAISHILASTDDSYVPTNAYYDYQVSLFKENASIEKSTSALSKTTGLTITGVAARGNSGNSYPYYLNPVSVASESTAFTTGLNFALAHINVQLAGSAGNIACYDEISATSPVNASVAADTVALAENRDRFNDATSVSYLTQSGTTLEPDGGATKGYTGLKATLNRGTGATFANSANTANAIYRYMEVNIVRVVEVTYDIVRESGTIANTDKIALMLQPALSIPVTANAITSISEDHSHDNTVRFRKLVVSGDTIDVYTVLPNGLAYGVSRTPLDPQETETYTVGDHTVTLGDAETAVHITVHLESASPTWGLQNRNGTVTQ